MERRSGAFGGATLRIVMDRSQAAPTAQLGLGVRQVYERTDPTGVTQRIQTPGVEVRLASTGKPLLMVGGQNSASMKKRLGFAGSTGTILLVVGGIAAAAVLVTLLSDDDDRACPLAPPC